MGPERLSHRHQQVGIALFRHLHLFRQVLQHVRPGEQEVGVEQDSPGALLDAAINAGLDVRLVQFAERHLDDVAGAALFDHAGDHPQGVIRFGNAGTVSH